MMIKLWIQRSVFFIISICIVPFSGYAQYIANPDIYSIAEDYDGAVFDVAANDNNLTGELEIYIDITIPPSHGEAVIDDVNDLVIYTPALNYFGSDVFTYTACADTDPDICGSNTITVTITASDDAPDAVDDFVNTYINTPVMIFLIDNDIDFDAEGVEFAILLDPEHGEATKLPFGGPYDSIYYEPNELDFIGADSIIYQLCKIGSDIYCDTATIYINVLSLNFNSPLAKNDTATVFIEATADINVLANDFDGDGDALIISELLMGGAAGDAFITGSNTVDYTPAALGTDDFRYVVCDDGIPSFCDTAFVHIIVTDVPDEGPVVDVPNSFSPNSDGINDVLEINGLDDFSGFNLKIFNRWSSLIFESKDIEQPWDGKSNVEAMSSTGDVPEGTYYYILYLDGVIDPLTGFIVVKR
ncbi:MAG: Ig-like domain-containing protein [Chitinophagales bacterium]